MGIVEHEAQRRQPAVSQNPSHMGLCCLPGFASLSTLGMATVGQSHPLCPAIVRVDLYGDITYAFKRFQQARDGRRICRKPLRQRTDINAVAPPQTGEQAHLADSQSVRGQRLVIDLGDPPCQTAYFGGGAINWTNRLNGR